MSELTGVKIIRGSRGGGKSWMLERFLNGTQEVDKDKLFETKFLMNWEPLERLPSEEEC